jgi:hypothetical protein
MSERNSSREDDRAYPLIALVNLATAIVAIGVCVNGPGVLEEAADPNAIRSHLLMAFCIGGTGAVFGGIIGLGFLNRCRSAILCGGTGMFVGLITYAAFISPPPLAPALVAIFLPVITVGIFRSSSD